jgi:hypothetical protein
MPDSCEIFLGLQNLTGIDQFALRQEHQLVKHGYNITTRLVNCKYDSAIVVSCQRHETFHDVVRVERIQTLKETYEVIGI